MTEKMPEHNKQQCLQITKSEMEALINDVTLSIYSENEQKLSFNKKKNLWLPVLKGKNWKRLQKLDLQDCDIEANQIKVLTLISLPNLKYLKLNNNNIGSQGAHRLLSNLPPKLEQLWLWKCKITELRIKQIEFKTLTQLRLFDNRIGKKGIQVLVKCSFPVLNGLGLKKCGIETSGAKILAKSNFPNLEAIDLRINSISADGFSTIYEMPLQKLKEIGIDEDIAGVLGCINVVKSSWPKMSSEGIFIDYCSGYFKRDVTKIISDRFSS